MGDSTGIEWTDATWNPTIGCSRVSEGCRHCYAEQQAARIVRMGRGKPTPYDGLVSLVKRDVRQIKIVNGHATGDFRSITVEEPRWTGAVRFLPERLSWPIRKRKPLRIFVDSMSDLFHDEVTNEQIAAVFGVMAASPQHTFQILTKRPARMRAWFATPGIVEMVEQFRCIALAGRLGEFFEDERVLPIVGWDDYLVTSRGRVLSTSGSDRCQWCKESFVGDLRKKFCSAGCRSKAHYEQQQGRWTPPTPSAKEMQPMAGESGHMRVMLYRNGEQERFLVHRLVLEAFDRPGRDGEQACHIDGDPSNNALWNLRWGTPASNRKDSERHGTGRRYSKLTEDQVEEIRRLGASGVSGAEIGRRFDISDTQARNIVSVKQWQPEHNLEWPLRSVWIGVSVENQAAADERIPELLRTPAAVRFISAEPLLGQVDLHGSLGERTSCSECGDGVNVDEDGCCTMCGADAYHVGVDQVIAGCESGPGARPADVAWYRSLRDQCAEAGVAYFLKQAEELPRNGCDAVDLIAISFGPGSKRKPGGIIGAPYLRGADGVPRQHLAFPEVLRG